MSASDYLVFSDAHELTIDDKFRLFIPIVVRREMRPDRDGQAFYVVEGVDGRLCLYPELYYKAVVAREQSELMPDEDALAWHRWNLGAAKKIAWDKQGRLLIPEETLQEAGINKEVCLVGVYDHLELWNRAEWEAERQALRQRKAEIALKRKQMKQQKEQA